MFTFNAMITGRVRTATVAANGSQPGDGTGLSSSAQRSTSTDVLTGIIVVGSGGVALVNGVDYLDIPFVAKANSFGVDGAMEVSPVQTNTLPDLDLELRDAQGNVLSSSANFGPREWVSAMITPGETYVYRVIGFVNAPTQVTITSKQYFPAGMGPGDGGGGGAGSGSAVTDGPGFNCIASFAIHS